MCNRLKVAFLCLFAIVLFPIHSYANKINGTTPGSIPDDFEVTTTGNASYSIPIDVPMGINGMQPSLGLSYSSNGKNGLLGMGWSLTGIQTITRGPSTTMKDGRQKSVDFSPTDRFHLNGEPLISLSSSYGYEGTIYRPEHDNFTQVVSYGRIGNAPLYFVAYTKSGLICIFGGQDSDNGRIYAQGRTDRAIMAWPITRISDRSGNEITFSYGYNQSTGEYWPEEINYRIINSVPYAKVKFTYDEKGPRPDNTYHYMGGSPLFTTKRLTGIVTQLGNFCSTCFIRKYEINYTTSFFTGRSVISNIAVTGSDGNYYSSTDFTWSDGSLWAEEKTNQRSGVSDENKNAPGELADITGDGIYDIMATMGNGFWVWSLLPDGFTGKQWTNGNFNGIMPGIGDFTGDGKKDIAFAMTDESLRIYPSGGDHFLGYQEWIGLGGGFRKGGMYIGDFNGDGIDDILNPSDTTGEITAWISNGKRFVKHNWDSGVGLIKNINVGDFNGDSKTDFIGSDASGNYYIWFSNDESFEKTFIDEGPTRIAFPDAVAGNILAKYSLMIGDVNGDGLSDLIEVRDNGTGYVRISNGRGFFSAQPWIFGIPVCAGSSIGEEEENAEKIAARTHLGDFNGDGMDDLAVFYPGSGNDTAYIAYSSGNGFKALRRFADVSNFKDSRVADVNGDGLADISCLTGYSGAYGFTDHIFLTSSTYPDLLQKVINGTGEYVSVTYGRLNDSSVHKLETKQEYPHIPFTGAFYVISETRQSNGVGGERRYSYNYRDGSYDAARSRFQGYGKIIITDHREPAGNDIETTYEYIQQYPFAGEIKSVDVKLNGTKLMKHVDYESYKAIVFKYGSYTTIPEINQLEDGSYNYKDLFVNTQENYRTFFTYPHEITESLYEISSSEDTRISEVKTIIDYTGLGNLDTKTVTTTTMPDKAILKDLHEKTEKYGYENITFDEIHDIWNCGNLSDAWITSAYTNKGITKKVERYTKYRYYNDSHKLSSYGKVAEEHIAYDERNKGKDADPSLMKSTYYTYDNYGYISSVKELGYTTLDKYKERLSTYTHKPSSLSEEIITVNPMQQESSTMVYARHGNPENILDINKLPISWSYDGFGRKLTETRPDGTITTWSYGFSSYPDSNAYSTVRITETGKSDIYEHYDMLGRLIVSESSGFNGQKITKSTTYDNLGRVSSESRWHFNGGNEQSTSYTYDDNDRIIAKDSFDIEGLVTYDYGFDTNKIVATANYPKGQKITKRTNALGWVLEVNQNSVSSYYSYEPFGNMVNASNGIDKKTEIEYDRLGRKKTLNDPDLGKSTYTYNGFGELTLMVDARTNETRYAYDELGRLRTKTVTKGKGQGNEGKCFTKTAITTDPSASYFPDQEITTWTYDDAPLGQQPTTNKAKGVLSTVTVVADRSQKLSEKYTYDSICRLSTKTKIIDRGKEYVTETGYDYAGRISRIIYPETGISSIQRLAVGYHYNSYGYLDRVFDSNDTGKSFWTVIAYNAVGQVTQEQIGNGPTTSRVYKPGTGRIESITTPGIQDFRYGFDELGNMTLREDRLKGISETFPEYDNLNRLRKSRVGSVTMEYSYGDSGNITSKTDVGSYKYGDDKHIHAVTQAGSTYYDYDAAGNMYQDYTKSGSNNIISRKFAYNANNQLVWIKKITGFEANLLYGAGGELVKQVVGSTVTVYVDGLFEVNTTGGVSEYRHYISASDSQVYIVCASNNGGSNLVKNTFLYTDHLGSITAMRDDKDGVFNTNFAPFGDRRNASKWDFTNIPKPEELANLVTRHGFTGHIGLEEFGLIHMQGRVYDPKLGRFLSADPFVQAPFNTQSLNRYTYCLNNPLRYIDPSGFWWGGKGGSTRGLPSSCGGRGGNRYTTNGNSSYNGGGSPGSVNFSSLGHKSSGKSRFGISAPSRSTMAYAGLPGGIDPGTWAEQHPNAYNDYMLSQGRSFNQANDEQGKIYTEDTCQVDGESLDIELVSVDDKTKNIINGIQILDDMMTAFSLYSFLSGLGDIADVCDQARQLRNMKNYCAGNDLDPRCKPWTTTEGSRRLDSGIEYYENKCLNGLGKKVKEGANLSY